MVLHQKNTKSILKEDEIEKTRMKVIGNAEPKKEIKKKAKVIISLGIPEEMLERINTCVEERVGILRTGWILEAIEEKLISEKRNLNMKNESNPWNL